MAVLTGNRGEVIQVSVPAGGTMRPRGSFWAPTDHFVGLVLEDIRPGRAGPVMIRGLAEGIPKINETVVIARGSKLCTADGEFAVANTHVAIYSIGQRKRVFTLIYGRTTSEAQRARVRLSDGDYTPEELALEMRNKIRAINVPPFNFNTFQVTYDSTERKFTWSVGPAGTNVVRRIGFDWTGGNGGDAQLAPVLGFVAGTDIAAGAVGASVESTNAISQPDRNFSSFVGYSVGSPRGDTVDMILAPGVG